VHITFYIWSVTSYLLSYQRQEKGHTFCVQYVDKIHFKHVMPCKIQGLGLLVMHFLIQSSTTRLCLGGYSATTHLVSVRGNDPNVVVFQGAPWLGPDFAQFGHPLYHLIHLHKQTDSTLM